MDAIDQIKEAAEALAAQKNNAYAERNHCVALIAKLAVANGYPAWVSTHSDDWDEVTRALKDGTIVTVSKKDLWLLTSARFNWVADQDGYIRDTRSEVQLHQAIAYTQFPHDRPNGPTGDWWPMWMPSLTEPPIPAGYTVDHIDQVPANNSRWNLRLATKRGQNLNRSLQAGKGVEKHGSKFRAYTSVDGKKITLGSYDTEAEAADVVAAYRANVLAKAEKDGTFLYPDAPWDRDWRTIIFIELPTGQLSWHIHDSERALFTGLPVKGNEWDGHTTVEKYARMQAYKPVEMMSDNAWHALDGLKKAIDEEPALRTIVKQLVG